MISIKDISIFADGLDHTECIAVHPDGSIWAGGEGGQIYRITSDGSKIEELNNTGGFILGIAFSPSADWLAVCDLKNKCIFKYILLSNTIEKFADGADGQYFNIPNFPAFDSRGRLYVSESGAFREVKGKIFCFDQEGAGKVWHSGPFNFANGLALSEDEKYLYIVCTWLPGVERVSINDNGTAGKREVYVTLPETCPDGIAFDREGSLYVSCYAPNRIYKINPDQEVRLLVDDWEGHTLSNPTNIAFGGNEFKELFTSNLGRWHISKLTLKLSGLGLACHQKR
ncbi:SMP-30/gluconolactonase/LRE family protein [soil metagenome]